MSHALPRATKMFADHQRHSRAHTRRFRPPTRLHDSSRDHTRPSSSMTSWWRHFPLSAWPVSLDPTRICDPVRTACKQKKKQRKRKRKSFDQVELWLWPKNQNFKKWPIPLIFSSTFRFWDLFLHLKLGNCANCPIPKKLTFAQILTKKSKFSRSTCLA